MEHVQPKVRKKKHRSPSYPAIGLEEALERARSLYQQERRHAALLDVVVSHWGFKPKSSSGLLCAAAMKKFGLLVEVPGKTGRYVRLSELALNIILDEQEESQERLNLISDAALKPEVHKELWDKYGAELPSDAALRTYLVRDRQFSEAAADQLIEEYRGTIAFAGLLDSPQSSDMLEATKPVAEENGAQPFFDSAWDALSTGRPHRLQPPASASRSPVPTGSCQDTVTLYEGPVLLTYPSDLSEESFQDLKDWLEVALRRIERSVKRKAVRLPTD